MDSTNIFNFSGLPVDWSLLLPHFPAAALLSAGGRGLPFGLPPGSLQSGSYLSGGEVAPSGLGPHVMAARGAPAPSARANVATSPAVATPKPKRGRPSAADRAARALAESASAGAGAAAAAAVGNAAGTVAGAREAVSTSSKGAKRTRAACSGGRTGARRKLLPGGNATMEDAIAAHQAKVHATLTDLFGPEDGVDPRERAIANAAANVADAAAAVQAAPIGGGAPAPPPPPPPPAVMGEGDAAEGDSDDEAPGFIDVSLTFVSKGKNVRLAWYTTLADTFEDDERCVARGAAQQQEGWPQRHGQCLTDCALAG
jgi:hypothetical protein